MGHSGGVGDVVMKLFCRHEWHVGEPIVMPSAFEQMGGISRLKNVPSWIFEKKFVLVMRCQKCSKVKIHTETSP